MSVTADVAPQTRRAALGALSLGAVVLLLGGLTANLGAAGACVGFPLCSGQVWPSAGGLAQLHWIHRLLAYLLTLHLMGLVLGAYRRAAPKPVRRAATLALALTVCQIVVAAVMVLGHLPAPWRALHAAVGAGLWMGLVGMVVACRTTGSSPSPS